MSDAGRRTNPERTRETRAALLAAARALFIQQGYAETGTPAIVAAAGLTRGALYHHFPDKRALFRAVVEEESALVAREIEAETASDLDAVDALVRGGNAYLAAMTAPGRATLLLVEAPTVLGRDEADALDARHAARTLRSGLTGALQSGALPALPLDPLVRLLGAVYDRAALAIANGADGADYRRAIERIVRGLADAARSDGSRGG